MLTQFHVVLRYREAIRSIVARDLKVRYSSSVLGVIWSLFSPLLMTLVYTLVFTVLVPSAIEQFPVFILAGLLPWNFFLGSVIAATGIITSNGHLINRVYFPREILPLSSVLSHGINFAIALLLLFGAILLFQVRLTATVLWAPMLILIQLVFTVGLALFLSALNVFFRDTQPIVDILMLAWFFLTPIIYPIELIPNPSLQLLIQTLNPMAALIVNYRNVFYYGVIPNLALLAVTTAEAVLMLLVGSILFRRLSPAFAEEI